MITSVKIQNYKCLREVEVDLSPLTVLVGPNSSGKSVFLEAIGEHPGNPVAKIWQRDQSLRISVHRNLDSGVSSVWTYKADEPPAFRKTGPDIVSKMLRLNVSNLRNLNQIQDQRQLNGDGGNLANVFATLTRTKQSALAKDLCLLVPMFQDIDARPAAQQAGNIRLIFQDRWNENVWYEPDEVSDGTMLLLAFLTLQFQEPAPALLKIEEPERGLHPYLLEQLINTLRRLSTGELGSRAVQVVMATHSAEMLDYLRPEEVRFMRRNEPDGSVIIESAPSESPVWEQAFQEYRNSLGSAWLAGGLGGVPGVG